MKAVSRSSAYVVLLGAILPVPPRQTLYVASGFSRTLLRRAVRRPTSLRSPCGDRRIHPRSILSRNMGTDEDQTTAFPPHKVIGNIYYVGTGRSVPFSITTPAGHILINSTYERNVRTIEKSVTELGFKFSDIRILLGTHAHGDHQEGDALIEGADRGAGLGHARRRAGARSDQAGGKAHPIDRTLHDGDEVTLGGTTLVAHLTAGHTRGLHDLDHEGTGGRRSFNVVFACSYRAPGNVTPEIENEFNRTFTIMRSLPCDVPLGDHPAQYNMTAKYPD